MKELELRYVAHVTTLTKRLQEGHQTTASTIRELVAELDGEIVAFQFSTPTESGVHLARITVDPSFQGRGIGALLLANTCEAYRRTGVRTVSLNTQADNSASQSLYRRFGFRPNGQKFPVWSVNI